MNKPQKKEFVAELAKKLSSSNSAILVNYSGMSVGMQQELKSRLLEVGATMLVVKNTLLKLGGESSKLPKKMLTDEVLSGQNALILAGEDPIAPLQLLATFAKEHDVPKLRVGVVEGDFQDEVALTKLSTLPGKDVLYAQVVGSIMSPLYGLVMTLNSKMAELVSILDQVSKGGERS